MPPLVLIILDGFGERAEAEANAVKLARMPNLNSFLSNYPHTLVDASGTAVGLPDRLMGNSEVGHLTLGAGRRVLLGLTRIYTAIEDGSFFENPVLKGAMEAALKNNSALHLMGLVSDGAVHAHQDHLYALLEMARRFKVEKVFVHCFTDGRDTSPQSALGFIRELEYKMAEIGVGKIATVLGRYYTMDRDHRWERTALAYRAMVNGIGEKAWSAPEAIEKAYQSRKTDEFILPTVILEKNSLPLATLQNSDAVIFFNFRADRARQLAQALTQQDFRGFERTGLPLLASFACFSEYDSSLHLPVAFPKIDIHDTFPQIISEKGLKQLRIAETEKYAHVTYFFSGGREALFQGEDRALIPSPKEVPTYDLKPEMNSGLVTRDLLERLRSHSYDFILCNYANPDMVGHTGNLQAAIRAVEAVDRCLGEVIEEVLSQKGVAVITADHGNCEEMADEQGHPHTAHTSNRVPFILIGDRFKQARLLPQGELIDVAPTLLKILGISQPREMMGKSLLVSSSISW